MDPIGFASGDLNLYRYVFNDPVNQVDPFGLQATSEEAAATRQAVSLSGTLFNIGRILVKLFEQVNDALIVQSSAEDGAGSGSGSGGGGDEAAPEGDNASPANPAGPAAGGEAPSAQPGAEETDLRHSEERQALNDIIKELTQGDRKLTNEEADVILDLAEELGIDARDNRGDDHWEGGSHIHVPQSGIKHIPVRSE